MAIECQTENYQGHQRENWESNPFVTECVVDIIPTSRSKNINVEVEHREGIVHGHKNLRPLHIRSSKDTQDLDIVDTDGQNAERNIFLC